jgi:hypothetical protein
MNNNNPYAPPTAQVADVPATKAIDTPFFAVSIGKLVLMSICTFGLYQIYWAWQNWQRVKERGEPLIWPIPRAIFGVFFCYPLFVRIRDYSHPSVERPPPAAGPLAAVWIVLQFASRLPDPYWFVTLFSFVCLLPFQAHVNRVNEAVAPGHDPNSRLTGWNWFGLVVGSVFIMLAIVGLLVPEEMVE